MRSQVSEVSGLFGSLSAQQADHAYAPGKWTVKPVLGHLTDTERVFSYRALSVARGDRAVLPNWEQDPWVPAGRFNDRPLESLLLEWSTARCTTIALLEGLPAEAPMRWGQVAGNPITVRTLACVLPGHLIWHLEVLKDRYL